MSDTLHADLFAGLGVLVLERTPDGTFRRLGPAPTWFMRLYPDALKDETVAVGERFPFLESFLPTAENYWASRGTGRIQAGLWVETYGSGKEVPLTAEACHVNDKSLLLIEYVRGEFERIKGLLQKARDRMLEDEQAVGLRRQIKQLRENGAALLAEMNDIVLLVHKNGEVLAQYTDNVPVPEEALAKMREAGRHALEGGGVHRFSGGGTHGAVAAISPNEYWAVIKE